MSTEVKNFIKKTFIVSLPIIIQELLANLSSLIDTMMVGQLENSASISGVYIATQILFIVNLLIYGSIEGASVYFSQYFGIKDEEGMQKSFAFKIIASVFVSILSMIVLYIFGGNFISLFTNDIETFNIAKDYLNIVSISIIPFALATTISSTLREYHKGLAPLIITIIAVLINIITNYLFIFGIGPFPYLMGVGAAIGTLLERLVRLIILIFILIKCKYTFTNNFFKSFRIEKTLFKNMFIKSLPLLFNEFLWAFSQTLLVFFFKEKSDLATSVLPIVTTLSNIVFVSLLGFGNGYGIVLANTIGQNKLEKAQKEAYITLIITTITCLMLGLFLLITCTSFVSIYKSIDDNCKSIAIDLLKFYSLYLLINGINTNLFFLLRAGGKTGVVFLFDCAYGYLISIPISAILCYLTNLDFKMMYIIVYSIDIFKILLGFILLFSKKWCKNLVMKTN